VNLQTLRYYERRGLLAESERSLGGHRLYPAGVCHLQVIAAALRAAVRAGCDDLVTCAGRPCCPIPFDAIAAGPDAAAT
jgi:MerR family transcriptional regulator, mercuric resistance operon regulatory protein